MAYSDYGAYVWKNGIDITKSAADKNYFYFKNEKKWYDYNALPDDMDLEKEVHAGMTHKITDNQGRPKLDQAIEHILSKYKKLQEDFEQIDNECNRLEAKEFKLENKINKLKDEMEKDKMEQFDDYVIYLIEKYLNVLEG